MQLPGRDSDHLVNGQLVGLFCARDPFRMCTRQMWTISTGNSYEFFLVVPQYCMQDELFLKSLYHTCKQNGMRHVCLFLPKGHKDVRNPTSSSRASRRHMQGKGNPTVKTCSAGPFLLQLRQILLLYSKKPRLVWEERPSIPIQPVRVSTRVSSGLLQSSAPSLAAALVLRDPRPRQIGLP